MSLKNENILLFIFTKFTNVVPEGTTDAVSGGYGQKWQNAENTNAKDHFNIFLFL